MSTFNIDAYDRRTLTRAINKIATPNQFVLQLLFGSMIPVGTDVVDIEVYSDSETIAQFVQPNSSEPHIIGKGKKIVQTVKLPRTNEKKVFTADEMKTINSIGNIYGGDNKAEQNAYLLRELTELKSRVLRLREWMACSALTTGKIEVAQDNIAFSLDYGYVSTKQLITLAGDNLWSSANSKPVKTLRTWSRSIAKASRATAKYVLLGQTAAEAFVSNVDVMKGLNNLNYRVGTVDLTKPMDGGVSFIGSLYGFEFYEYNNSYVDSSGTEHKFIADDRAVMIAPSDTFRLYSGPLFRFGTGNTVETINTDMLIEPKLSDDRDVLEWRCDQKSLPVIHDPGCIISAKVV